MGCANDLSIEVEKDKAGRRYQENVSSSKEEDIEDFEECESK